MTEPRVKHDGDLAVGQIVGEYVVEGKIGEGGFGTVFRATHPLIGKLAAIKVLARRYSADPEMVSRFVAEARAVNQIRHRGIIDIFGFGELDDGRSYYVMELLDGKTLDAQIAETGGMALADAIPILRGIARALDAAHAKGIVHRDLKPENVFLAVQPDGTVFPKLLDFGIAKLFGGQEADAKHRTATGAPIGTPSYMSPEQCRGRDVDHRTDIYAFGCVAYEMLCGRVPFEADDHLSVLFKQISEEPEPVSQRANLPAGVDDAIAWMMAKEPAHRAPDLISAVRELERAATAAGIAFVPDPEQSASSLTPVPGRLVVPVRDSKRSITPFENAHTMAASGDEQLPALPSRRRGPLLAGIAICVVAVTGVVVGLALRGDDAPAQAATVATPPVEKSAPRFVTITIRGAPDGTEVFGPAGPLGNAPGEVQMVHGAEDVQLTLRAEGYATTTVHVTPASDRAIDVELAKKVEPPPVVAEPEPEPAAKPAQPTPKKKSPVVKKKDPEPEKAGPGITPDPYGRK